MHMNSLVTCCKSILSCFYPHNYDTFSRWWSTSLSTISKCSDIPSAYQNLLLYSTIRKFIISFLCIIIHWLLSWFWGQNRVDLDSVSSAQDNETDASTMTCLQQNMYMIVEHDNNTCGLTYEKCHAHISVAVAPTCTAAKSKNTVSTVLWRKEKLLESLFSIPFHTTIIFLENKPWLMDSCVSEEDVHSWWTCHTE